MVASRVSEPLVVQSHAGPYEARFVEGAFERLPADMEGKGHWLVDERVAGLYERELAGVLAEPSLLLIEATEPAKSLERFPGYVERLVHAGVRRGDRLVAIGGGILQDITCFLAATLLRGLPWAFYPTTLLAQADSCIGSKSSINVGRAKNVLGTFTPPTSIVIDVGVLETLDERDVRSGIGEMLKVHAIAGPEAFDEIASDYEAILADRAAMTRYVRRSLELKRELVERDEFDRGPRNVMNYGHSFGHAIEAATDFLVPHGIAVTIGMDMANFVAAELGRAQRAHFDRMHATLATNYAGFEDVEVPLDEFMDAIAKDKKNVGAELRLVLPGPDGRVALASQPADERFRAICAEYLESGRR